MKDQYGNYIRPNIIFAELETGGKRVECPRCHVPFNPHLGNLIAEKFQCENCKGYLCYRNSPARTPKCPCCGISRPLPNNLILLYCGGCNVKIIYQKSDRAVKCSLCKHITTPPDGTYGVRPSNRVVPPQVNRVFPPRVNRRNRKENEETESTASSSFTPKPEIIVLKYPDDSVAETVKNVAVGMRTNKREVEEDKAEASESKKIRF